MNNLCNLCLDEGAARLIFETEMEITKIAQLARNRFQKDRDVAMMAMKSYMTQGALHVVSDGNPMSAILTAIELLSFRSHRPRRSLFWNRLRIRIYHSR